MADDTKVNIIWFDGFRGNWDSGLIHSIIDNNPKFNEVNSKDNPVFDEVIVLVGKTDKYRLREYLSKTQKALVILMSDEDSAFDYEFCVAPHVKFWTQYHYRNKERIKKRIPLGVPSRFKDYKVKSLDRKYSVSFVGQVQNEHRQQCVEVIKQIPNSFIHIASGFGGVDGLEYQDYLDILCQSEVVVCPSGSMCTDSFRVYEAIECGALPIADANSPRDYIDFNYWKECNFNVPSLQSWKTLPDLLNPMYIKEQSEITQNWWSHYKQILKQDLETYF